MMPGTVCYDTKPWFMICAYFTGAYALRREDELAGAHHRVAVLLARERRVVRVARHGAGLHLGGGRVGTRNAHEEGGGGEGL